MARPIWRGSLSFGLVAIPMQLHTAVREARARFRLLHARDKSPVKYERVCQKDGTPVAWENLVKGFEYQKGRFVVLSKDDFKAAAVEKDRRVQVSDFVPDDAIDDRYFDQPYYLLPDKGGEHAYAVFVQALQKTRKVGIGKVVLRERQHLVAIESLDGRLVLTMLRFAKEVVEAPALTGVDNAKITAKELQLAGNLIDALATEWNPEQYTDDYQEKLREVIDAKLKGETVTISDDSPELGAEVADLAERLRASLAVARGGKGAGAMPKRSASAPSTRSARSGQGKKTTAAETGMEKAPRRRKAA